MMAVVMMIGMRVVVVVVVMGTHHYHFMKLMQIEHDRSELEQLCLKISISINLKEMLIQSFNK